MTTLAPSAAAREAASPRPRLARGAHVGLRLLAVARERLAFQHLSFECQGNFRIDLGSLNGLIVNRRRHLSRPSGSLFIRKS